jgi:hypothetical protein
VGSTAQTSLLGYQSQQTEQNQHYATTENYQAESDASWAFDEEVANRMVHATPAPPVKPATQAPHTVCVHGGCFPAPTGGGGGSFGGFLDQAWNEGVGGSMGALALGVDAVHTATDHVEAAVRGAADDFELESVLVGGDLRYEAASLTLSDAANGLKDASHGLFAVGVGTDFVSNVLHHPSYNLSRALLSTRRSREDWEPWEPRRAPQDWPRASRAVGQVRLVVSTPLIASIATCSVADLEVRPWGCG